MRSLKTIGAMTGLSLWACRSVALAHTPYLLPNAFDAERDHTTLQASLTEDDYFSPDIAIKADGYVETTPTGETALIAAAAVLKDVALIEAPLADAGTYRFSTGMVVGRKMSMAQVGGRWVMVRPVGMADHGAPKGEHGGEGGKPGGPPGEGPPSAIAEADVPAGAARVQVENVLTAETYVSKGAPTQVALKTSGHGFELKPITHPNSVYLDEGFAFQILIDGAPAPSVGVTVYRAGNVYDDRKITTEVNTNIDGLAKVSFDRPGVYLLTAHYPAGSRAPDTAPPAKSYVYSLTFEVTR